MVDNSQENNSETNNNQLNPNQLNNAYQEQGYFVIRNYFNAAEIASLREVILKFHNSWKKDNAEFYKEEELSIVISGGFHQIADFVSRVSKLSRIITFHNFNIKILIISHLNEYI